MMPRNTPVNCMRGLECAPLHAVIDDDTAILIRKADDESTFVCCGLHGQGSQDEYRFCFKSVDTDTMYDYDELDLLDTVEVITRAISTRRRIIQEGVNYAAQ